MKPAVLFTAFGLFVFCLTLHILLWRFRHPRRHALALLVIFLGPLVLFPFVAVKIWPLVSWIDLVAVSLLHIALSSAYIQIYPASQADSPSLRILRVVEGAAPRGLTEEEIHISFDPEKLLEARIRDLLEAGLVSSAGDALTLTGRGRMLITPFIYLRKILGLRPGKG